MNHYLLATVLLLFGCQTQAVTCKITDAQGVVTYSEVPESACEEPMIMRRIPPNFRSPAPASAPPPTPSPAQPQTAPPAQPVESHADPFSFFCTEM